MYKHAERPPKNRRLDDQSEPEGRLLHGTHRAPPQEITPFQVARTDISVQLPAIRSVFSSLVFTTHPVNANVGERKHSRTDLIPGEPGVHHKLPQVSPYINTKPRISGLCNQFLQVEDQTAWREDKKVKQEQRNSLILWSLPQL